MKGELAASEGRAVVKGELAASEALGGPRCRHEMIAAWCSICLGHDDTVAMAVQSADIHGTDLLSQIHGVTTRQETRRGPNAHINGTEFGSRRWAA